MDKCRDCGSELVESMFCGTPFYLCRNKACSDRAFEGWGRIGETTAPISDDMNAGKLIEKAEKLINGG